MPEPFNVSLSLYNSAGELVRTLYSGFAANPVSMVQVAVNGPQAGGAPVQVVVTGLGGDAGAEVVWNGMNNNGQSVQNGMYYLKLSSTNSFGQTSTLTKQVPVVGAGATATLAVYNSAGEVVTDFSLAGLPAAAVGASIAPLKGGAAVVAPAGSTSTASGGLDIQLALANGATETVYWNGRNSQGQPLQPGSYTVQFTAVQPGSGPLTKSMPVILLAGPDPSPQAMAASALIAPNPVLASTGAFTVQYTGDGLDSAWAQVYSLDGELLGSCGAGPGGGPLNFRGKWSGGVYLVDFEVRDGQAVLARKVLKLAVVR